MLLITVNIFTLAVKLRTSGGRKEIKADFIAEHASKKSAYVQLPIKTLKYV